MRRHDLTKASLIFSLACMTLLGGYGVGAKSPQASSSRSPEAESSRIVEGSKVTLQYVASVPGSTGIDYGNVSEFIQGRHEIFPALEQEVVGMKPGEEKQVELNPEENFGPHDEGKQLIISKTLLPPGAKQAENFSSLNQHFGGLLAVADGADAAPTTQATAVYKELEEDLEKLNTRWAKIRQKDIPALNAELKKAGLASVDPSSSPDATASVDADGNDEP